MSSLGDDLWTGAAVVLDTFFGEPVEFRPQLDSEIIVAGADPDRPVRALIGIFTEQTVIAKPVGAGADTHETVEVSTTRTVIDFDASLFLTSADQPRQGDVLALTGRAGSPRYQVESTEPDNISRVLCIVTPLGSS